MSKFFVTCARGVEDITEAELRAIGVKSLEKVPGGVHFEGDQEVLYRAHLWLRTGNRILLVLRSFQCYSPEDLYNNLKLFKWETFFKKGKTFAVDCTISGPSTPTLSHSHYAKLKAKDAIVDRMREKTGDRPNVNADRPDISVVLYIRGGVCTLNIDATGSSLHERGYRPKGALAPLKETLAAAILRLAGWEPGMRVVDPMCGSGTLLAEAALASANIAPGLLRPSFAFMHWPDFFEPRWERCVQEAEEKRLPLAPGLVSGFDESAEALRQAQWSFRVLGLADSIAVAQKRFEDFTPPPGEPGLILMNPPYGERLGEVDELKPLYKSMGDIFKQRCAGWRAAVLTGSSELAKCVGLRAKKRIPVWNGPLECRLLTYDLYARAGDVVAPQDQ